MEEKQDKKYSTITIPVQLADKIKEKIDKTGFHSVSSFVTYVMRQVLSNIDEDQEEALPKDKEEEVKKRLRSLGYL